MNFRRTWLALLFGLALCWAQFREPGDSRLAGHLELVTEPRLPARVYLFKDGKPFRLSPVDALLPLNVDLFYRERLWRQRNDPATLEVTSAGESHFLLLKGHGDYELPAGQYRVEAYRGLFYKPFTTEFELKAGQSTRVVLQLENWAGDEARQWLSGDDHIHLTRDPEDNAVFLGWLAAEDLSVGNFLQLQRQKDAAVQYGFGPAAEARSPGRSIRSGHESRSEFFGHVNLLGGREIIRPLSVGSMYANSPDTYPYPAVLFARGRELEALTGYAHFQGSMPHSTQLLDLALGHIDFIEVFQFGVLKTDAWYELLNAGLRITGIAGSDFPVPLDRLKPWPRAIPLLGPERTLVRAAPRGSAYEAWADGVRRGDVVVSNGPLVDLTVDDRSGKATARARYSKPLEWLEIVINGAVAGRVAGGGTALTVSATLPKTSFWVAARTKAVSTSDEPEIQAHTNPVYREIGGQPVRVADARQALARRWEEEIAWYRQGPLRFPTEERRAEFFRMADEALQRLRQ